ncbi:hypothetical protein [Fuchsiella alkaliacetigena]|uniref:hypothetical protein n=1 Tax=Fuchsiella alkaliacetigena TaxID=957042 RepID=UPI00200ACD61|nr:hypothetical protein [Fuchsiella alkaliacetigena]MCK8825536.1 hypothetical protein [Fuchsiella alkaliacetigena]
MEREEYEKWVDYVIENWGPPRSILSKDSYGNWLKELILVRFLISLKKYQPAFKLSKDILSRELDCKHEVDNTDQCLKCIEHEAWAKEDLGTLYWKVENDAEQGLEYANQALELLELIPFGEESLFIVRGEFFKRKLELLKVSGKEKQAVKEADQKVEYMQAKMPEVEKNSYIFYSYLFKAELAESKEDYQQAFNKLKEAFNQCGMLTKCDESPEEVLKNNKGNYKKAYKRLLGETTPRVWEI